MTLDLSFKHKKQNQAKMRSILIRMKIYQAWMTLTKHQEIHPPLPPQRSQSVPADGTVKASLGTFLVMAMIYQIQVESSWKVEVHFMHVSICFRRWSCFVFFQIFSNATVYSIIVHSYNSLLQALCAIHAQDSARAFVLCPVLNSSLVEISGSFGQNQVMHHRSRKFSTPHPWRITRNFEGQGAFKVPHIANQSLASDTVNERNLWLHVII